MSYIVSARKYRPLTFEDVVGQEQITSTLKKAIESDHLAQAFLFCGPRGVGKTTCARILAKAVNTGKTEKLDEIDEDFAFNIFELDAASNNKVEDMHQLIAQVRIPPQTGKYKIYIIDEVHMLSSAAFNAFLKTLEEPPPYAIFILATTEKHKILPTILSRCQIYDFKRISVNDIVGHLKNIAAKEGIKAEENALHIVAEKADGALRDALSIFDRLVSFSGDHLTYEAVVKNLNVLDYDYFFRAVDALSIEDVSSCLLLFNDVLNNGFEGDHFVLGLAEHLRNLLVCKDERTIKLLEVSDSLSEKYKAQSQAVSNAFIINALSLASDTEVQYAQSQHKRLLVEMMLMKIAYAARAIKGEDLVSDEKKKPLAKVAVAEPKATIEEEITELEVTPEVKESPKEAPVEPTESEVEIKSEETVPEIEEEVPVEVIEKATETVQPKTASAGFSLEDLEKQVAADLQQKNTPAEIEEDLDIGPTEDLLELTDEHLESAWEQILEELGEDGEMQSLHQIIDDKVPSIEGDSIVLMVDSEVEQSRVKKSIPQFVGLLKNKLDLQNYSFEIGVNTIVKKKKHILNAKEQLDLIIKRNPAVKELKDQLGLELNL